MMMMTSSLSSYFLASPNTGYYFCAYLACRAVVCVFALLTIVIPAKTDEPIVMPLEGELARGPSKPRVRWGCTLAPPGEYNDLICAAVAMRAVTAITGASCYHYVTKSTLLSKDSS